MSTENLYPKGECFFCRSQIWGDTRSVIPPAEGAAGAEINGPDPAKQLAHFDVGLCDMLWKMKQTSGKGELGPKRSSFNERVRDDGVSKLVLK